MIGNSKGKADGEGYNCQWTEEKYKKELEEAACEVNKAVFVECFNVRRDGVEGGLAEAKWVLEMAKDPNSIVAAVVAHIPCKQGGQAVEAFLNDLRDENGQLPKELKGGR